MNLQVTIKKAIKGDEESFVELMQERKEKMYRIAYTYAKNQQDTLDIVQESVYKAYISIHTLKKVEYFDTWLVRIVINNALDYLKKAKKIIYMDEQEYKNIDNGIEGIENSMDLYVALDKLDTKYKTVIMLKYFEDLTFPDIADIMNCPVSTVKTYLYSGLKKLKINIEEVM